jgi:hypothetical protein
MTSKKIIPLPVVPRALTEITLDGETVTYDTIRKAGVNCVFPIIRGPNGRYSVEEDRLPEIALALGLKLRTDPVAA